MLHGCKGMKGSSNHSGIIRSCTPLEKGKLIKERTAAIVAKKCTGDGGGNHVVWVFHLLTGRYILGVVVARGLARGQMDEIDGQPEIGLMAWDSSTCPAVTQRIINDE